MFLLTGAESMLQIP